ncbi:MAG: NAD(P)H-dependent oxidoreductase [Zavarzinella sp.]
MSEQPTIVAISGSTRKESFNTKLLKIVARGAEAAGAKVTIVDLNDYPMPLFNEDLEKAEGLPKAAADLKALMAQHRGLIIASPEYNSSISPLLKNTIDWVSRKVAGEQPMMAYRGKIASLVAASPGAMGGLRGLVHVRAILQNIGVTVLPGQFAVSQAGQAFDESGNLKDAATQTKAENIGKELAEFLLRLAPAN